MFKNYRGIIMFCAVLSLTATGSAWASVTPRATPVDPNAAYQEIFGGGSATQAQCTADCGDGTGWQCTGANVYCEDGVGCIAEGSGGGTAIGLCSAS